MDVQQELGLPSVHIGLLHGHKAVIAQSVIGDVWKVEIGTFFATFDSLERAKQSAEIVLRDRAKRRVDKIPFESSDPDQFAWVNWANLGPAVARPPSDPRINDYERSYQHALTLANALHDRKAPVNDGWKPEGDLPGLILQIDNMVAGLIIESTEAPDPAMKALKSASVDNQALKDAGNAMAAASFRVATEYDGCHRLMLAVSDWARAVANEGGRGDAK